MLSSSAGVSAWGCSSSCVGTALVRFNLIFLRLPPLASSSLLVGTILVTLTPDVASFWITMAESVFVVDFVTGILFLASPLEVEVFMSGFWEGLIVLISSLSTAEDDDEGEERRITPGLEDGAVEELAEDLWLRRMTFLSELMAEGGGFRRSPAGALDLALSKEPRNREEELDEDGEGELKIDKMIHLWPHL